jgi:hypothetical protein
MDGIHDMGGMHGFGKVEPEKNEPVFHAAWEGRCLALNRAMGAIGAWTIDEGRAGIEALPPEVYLSSSYYGKWALRLLNMVVARGLAGADELDAGHALRDAKPLSRKLTVADVPRTLTRGSFGRPAPSPARLATACARKTFTRRRTRGCRVTRAAMSASSKPFAAATFSRIPQQSAASKIRNGSTPSFLTRGNCLARRPIRR